MTDKELADTYHAALVEAKKTIREQAREAQALREACAGYISTIERMTEMAERLHARIETAQP